VRKISHANTSKSETVVLAHKGALLGSIYLAVPVMSDRSEATKANKGTDKTAWRYYIKIKRYKNKCKNTLKIYFQES